MKRKLCLLSLLLLVSCSTSISTSSMNSSQQSLSTSFNQSDNIDTSFPSSLLSSSSEEESSSSTSFTSESDTESISSVSSSASSSQTTQKVDLKDILAVAKKRQLENEVAYKVISTEIEEKLAYDEYVTKNESVLDIKEYENGLIRNEVNKIYHDDNIAYSYQGEGKVAFHNNQYIDYMKYNVNREDLVSAKEDYIKAIDITNLKEYMICDVVTQITNNEASLKDGFTLNKKDENTTYSLNCTKIEEQSKKEEYQISFVVNNNNQIISYNFEQKTYSYDWLKEDFKQTYGLTKLSYEITYGSITSETISLNDVCVSDVNLKLYNTLDSSYEALDTNNIRINTIFDVMVIDYIPSSALDTHFYISSSSNQEVVAKTSYGAYQAVGVGTSTLTIKNELGFTKIIEVNTFAPELEAIDFDVNSSNLYIGNEYKLSISVTPSDAVSEFEVTSSNNGVIEIVKKGKDYYLSCKSTGYADITVSSKENSNISKTKSYEVKETTLKQFLLDNIFKGYDYTVYSEIKIEFINSFQSKICFDSDEKLVTYTINSNVIKFSSFDCFGSTYVTNTLTLNSDLTSASLSLIDEFYYSTINTTLEVVAK